eukprot:3685241-Prymnesium_polylepis.1
MAYGAPKGGIWTLRGPGPDSCQSGPGNRRDLGPDLPLLVTNSASRRLAHTYRCGTRPRPAHHRFGRTATAPTTVTSYPLS